MGAARGQDAHELVERLEGAAGVELDLQGPDVYEVAGKGGVVVGVVPGFIEFVEFVEFIESVEFIELFELFLSCFDSQMRTVRVSVVMYLAGAWQRARGGRGSIWGVGFVEFVEFFGVGGGGMGCLTVGVSVESFVEGRAPPPIFVISSGILSAGANSKPPLPAPHQFQLATPS